MSNAPQRVLAYCLSGLGDAILASPALAALARQPERFRLTLLTMFGSVQEYLQDQQFTGDVRLVKFLGMSKLQILRHTLPLRQERFDVSIVPYAMNRLGYNIMSRVVGAKCRIGFRYQRQPVINLPQLNQFVIDEDPALHAVEENLRWAGHLLGVEPAGLPDELCYRIHPEALDAADEFLKQHGLEQSSPLIGIHAGCNSLKNQNRRCWPAFRFGELIRQVQQDLPGARFVLFEGPTDGELNEAIISAAASDVAVAKMLPMRVVAALMTRCQLFVSNDSGLMHTAAACKVPCVSIFGPTNPTWVRPWKTRNAVVSRRLPCSPCFYYSSRPLSCPANLDFACVRELPLEMVKAAALELLRETPVAVREAGVIK
jgi:heptosyltransferase-2